MGYLKRMIARVMVDIRTVELEVELQELKAAKDDAHADRIALIARAVDNLHKYIDQN